MSLNGRRMYFITGTNTQYAKRTFHEFAYIASFLLEKYRLFMTMRAIMENMNSSAIQKWSCQNILKMVRRIALKTLTAQKRI